MRMNVSAFWSLKLDYDYRPLQVSLCPAVPGFQPPRRPGPAGPASRPRVTRRLPAALAGRRRAAGAPERAKTTSRKNERAFYRTCTMIGSCGS